MPQFCQLKFKNQTFADLGPRLWSSPSLCVNSTVEFFKSHLIILIPRSDLLCLKKCFICLWFNNFLKCFVLFSKALHKFGSCLLWVECSREDGFGFAVPASETSVRTKVRWRRQHKSRKLVSHNFVNLKPINDLNDFVWPSSTAPALFLTLSFAYRAYFWGRWGGSIHYREECRLPEGSYNQWDYCCHTPPAAGMLGRTHAHRSLHLRQL